MAKPVLHARDHLPGGADPILGLTVGSGGSFDTYRDWVLAQPSLWSYWPMDEPSGSTSIADIIGGRDLALQTGGSGPAPTFEADGPFPDLPAETAIEFSGSEGVGGNQARFQLAISAGERDAIFGGLHAYTIDAWFYPTAIPSTGGGGVKYFDPGVPGQLVELAQTAGSGGSFYTQRGSDGLANGPTYTLNAWKYCRCTYDGTTLKMFEDNTLVASDGTATTSQTSGGVIVFGNAGASPWRPFQGRIAHVAMFTEDLSTFPSLSPDGGGDAVAGATFTADGAGGTSWDYPTIEVTY